MALTHDDPQGPMWGPMLQALVFVALIGGLVWVALKIWLAVFQLVGAHVQ